MKFAEKTVGALDALLDVLLIGNLIDTKTTAKLKGSRFFQSTGGSSGGGGLDNPFSIEKERKNIYSGRAELDAQEQTKLDDFINNLAWWERLEFFEKFGDYDVEVPRAPRLPQNQQPVKQYSQMARNLRNMLDAGKTSTGIYDNNAIHKALESPTGLGLFKQSKLLNPYFALYQASERLKGVKKFLVDNLVAVISGSSASTITAKDVAQKIDSFWGKLAKKIDDSAKK